MTNFIPPPMDRKKKDKDEEGAEDDVSIPLHPNPSPPRSSPTLCNLTACSALVSTDQLQRHLRPRVLDGNQALHGADQREGDIL